MAVNFKQVAHILSGSTDISWEIKLLISEARSPGTFAKHTFLLGFNLTYAIIKK